MVATNTISQGDTREGSLARILADGGTVGRAVRRLKWPGEAAVVVSVIHIVKGESGAPLLDGKAVRRISAYLVEGDLDTSPEPLAANDRKAFSGSFVLGEGFTFDDIAAVQGEAESLKTMRALVEKDPENAERIFPFLGGDELNNSPTHEHSRYVIDFFDRPLRRDPALKPWAAMAAAEMARCRTRGAVPRDYPSEVAEDWPDLIEIVRRRVKPKRDAQKRDALRERWWQYADKRPGLYASIASLDKVLATGAAASTHHVMTFLSSKQVFSHKLVIFPVDKYLFLTLLHSRIHELWSARMGATLGDAPTYNPSDVFETFPFPEGFETDSVLEAAGKAYHDHRAALMIAADEGLTKTYNRFHDPDETRAPILELRRLHDAMDHAVLTAYDWTDLIPLAVPVFEPLFAEDEEETEGARRAKKKYRYRWPDDVRDEVLARLLALNGERAASERSAVGKASPTERAARRAKAATSAPGGDGVSEHCPLFEREDH